MMTSYALLRTAVRFRSAQVKISRTEEDELNKELEFENKPKIIGFENRITSKGIKP